MIAYRQPLPEDFPALRQIDAAAFPTSAADFEPGGDLAGWMACSGANPVAFALARRRSGTLESLVVLEPFRHRGIGSELLRQAVAWLFSHGWKTITTSQELGSTIPTGFLERHGWLRSSGTGSLPSKTNHDPVFRLEEHQLTDPATGYTRLVRLHRGPASRPHRICLILDGESYWRDMAAMPVFEQIASHNEQPLTLAFVGHVSAEARHHDFAGNERYARFLGGKVLPWLKHEIPSLTYGGHGVVGLSLSGLMAAHLAVRFPDRFACCLSQSGSHWWNPPGFAKLTAQHTPINARFWMSVGNKETATNLIHPPTGMHQEISQIEGVRHAVDALRNAGAEVHLHEYPGGHSMDCWRAELEVALHWMFRR